jgi:hypothetical protein
VKRLAQFALAALLLALVKEETALLAASLGVWAVWRFHRHISPSPHLPISLSIVVLSLAWFVVATFIIVPAHAVEVYGVAESGYFARYGALGDAPLDIFKSFFTQPGLVWQIATEPVRLDYLRGLLAPFGFLSLLAPEIVLLSLPLLLANLLSAYPAQYYGEFHYSAPLVPYFAAGAAYGLGRALGALGRWWPVSTRRLPSAIRRASTFALALWVVGWSIAAYGAAGRGPLGGRYDPTPISEHHRLLPHFVTQIPRHAAVTASAAVHPHVSHRRYIYQFPLGLDAPTPAEWALLDVTTNTDMAPGDLKNKVMEMLAGEWGVVDAADGFLLLRKGAAEKAIPSAFVDFTRIQSDNHTAGDRSASGQNDTGWSLQDWSFTVAEDWPRWRQTRLVATLWNVQKRFEPAIDLPTFVVVTPDGETLEPLSEATPPALVWWQMAGGRWQVAGSNWRITTLPLYLPRVWALVMSTPPARSDNDGRVNSLDSAMTVAEVAYRDADHRLRTLSWNYLQNDDLGGLVQEMAARQRASLQSKTGVFQWDGDRVTVASWQPKTVSPGQPLDLWIQWQPHPKAGTQRASAPHWPGSLTPFVHLRRAHENRGQADGSPRFFLAYDVAEWLNTHSTAPDWRVIPIPVDAPVGEVWQVVIGLYDPQTGQRADVLDMNGNVAGNEVVAGQVTIAPPPTPDQTCALIPDACASQVR